MSNWRGKIIQLASVVFMASFLWACEGNDGAAGAAGPQGPSGPAGPAGPAGPPADTAIQVGDGEALTADEIEELGKLDATITGVTVDSPPVVEFSVVDQHGNPAAGIAEGVVWFTFAKLVPNSDPSVNGGLPYWQSYINTVEDTTASTDRVKPDVLDVAVHATTDNSGTLEELGGGQYRYTFATDVANVTTPIAVPWEANLTHRVGLEIRLGGPGEVPLAPDNPVFDFVPDGGAGSGVSKEIAATENCGNCHFELAIHGGPRKSVEYCVTCHNPGTVDQDSGESMDMAYLTHSIHMGENRTNPFLVYGFGERFFSANDFSEVTYPQSVAYCETCHVASESHPDGNAWNAGATAKSCGGCHDNGLVAENFDAVTGVAEYSFDHAVSEDAPVIGVQDDGSCSGCHLGNIPTAGTALAVHSRISGDQRFRDELGDDFVFEVIDATGTGPGETPVITFRVTNAAGEPWDIMTAPEFDVANSSSMNLYTGWPGIENYNGGEAGATGGFRIRMNGGVAGEVPGEPEYYGAGHPNRMYLDVIQYYIANNVGASQDNGDGTYTVEYFTALPADFTGQAMVAIGGHPAAIGVADNDDVVGNQRAAASSVVWFAEGSEREYAFSAENCNACHKDLQFHGSNRNTNPEMCVICHNADLAEGEEGYALGRMVHAIHAASPSYAGGVFAEVTYPQTIANCDTCHVEGAYNTAREVARSVSLTAGLDETVWTDDFATTPTSQACGTCHTSVAALGHFNTQGGAVAITKDLIQQVGGLPNGQEACAVCHGPGNEFDTTTYHNPGLEE